MTYHNWNMVMLYIILTSFLSWVWKWPLHSHVTYHNWSMIMLYTLWTLAHKSAEYKENILGINLENISSIVDRWKLYLFKICPAVNTPYVGKIYEEEFNNMFIIRAVHKGRIFSKFVHHKSTEETWNEYIVKLYWLSLYLD